MKHFSIEEANQALPVVRELAEQMVAHRREQLRRRHELETVRASVAGNGGALDTGRLERLETAAAEAAAALARCVEEIHALGVQVKDVERGLVDFPARHPASGETVLLCWHLGESAIAYWHELDEGFAGRKSLPF